MRSDKRCSANVLPHDDSMMVAGWAGVNRGPGPCHFLDIDRLPLPNYTRGMQFYEYQTTRDITTRGERKTEKWEPFYKRNFGRALAYLQSTSTAVQMVNEGTWERNRRPYYCVYPAITPMLLKLNLAFDASLIKLPVPIFAIRFPTTRPPITFQWNNEDWHVRSMLVGPTDLEENNSIVSGLVIWVDTGEKMIFPDGKECPVHTYINLPLRKGMSMEESLDALPVDASAREGMQFPSKARADCVRLAATLCLLENNPEIVEPDVLTADRDKYDATRDQKFVDRAKRRGKVGWNVGRDIEVVPHMRRPHPAIVLTGHGRMIPKIIMRKGSLIHRKVTDALPGV
jgi:hypothetical protein